MRLGRELEVALAAVAEAARLTAAVQARLAPGGEPGVGIQKGDQSPVTVADFGAQALVCARLQEAFPADPVLGEEDSSALRAPGGAALRERVVEQVRALRPDAHEAQVLGWIDRGSFRAPAPRAWTLDPIDGTKGFLRGEQYAVALALLEDGQVVLAAMACPNLPPRAGGAGGSLVHAVRGAGAWQAPLEEPSRTAPIRVSPQREAAHLRVVMSIDPGHSDQERTLAIMRRLGIQPAPRKLDSLAKYALLARGEAEVYFRITRPPGRRENVWDHAAGALLVEAAGGTVTDLDGRPLDFGRGPQLTANRGVLSSNGPLHRELLAALAESERPA